MLFVALGRPAQTLPLENCGVKQDILLNSLLHLEISTSSYVT